MARRVRSQRVIDRLAVRLKPISRRNAITRVRGIDEIIGGPAEGVDRARAAPFFAGKKRAGEGEGAREGGVAVKKWVITLLKLGFVAALMWWVFRDIHFEDRLVFHSGPPEQRVTQREEVIEIVGAVTSVDAFRTVTRTGRDVTDRPRLSRPTATTVRTPSPVLRVSHDTAH